MKSILAKQAPQMSPCPPMRVRQTMQTGGRSRSASGESSDLSETAKGRAFALSGGAGTPAISASLIDMGAVIERKAPALEERRLWTR
jgi:hypothetical protein